MSKKQKSDINGIVFSTNSEYEYQFEEENVETLPNNKQTLKVLLDKKNRNGKAVTIINGFIGSCDDLKTLGKMLKTKCGVGGTSKDGEIIIQGDFVSKIKEILIKEGYKVR
jgi:translation initiation factor 1